MKLMPGRSTAALVVYGSAVAASAWLMRHAVSGSFEWWWPVAVVAIALGYALAVAPCGGERPTPRWRSGLLLLALVVAAAIAGRLTTTPGLEAWAVGAWIVFLAVAAAVGGGKSPRTDPADGSSEASGRVRVLPLASGIAISLVLALGAAWIVHGDGEVRTALLLWVGALAVAVVAAASSLAWQPEARTIEPPALSVELSVLLVLLAVTVALRVIALGDIPVVVDGDEGRIGQHVVETLRDPQASPFDVGWNGFSQLAFEAQGIFMDAAEPSLRTLRLGSATAGTLGVLLLYLLLRELCGWRVAVIGAAMLACNPEHIAWSRAGLMNVQAVTLVTFAMTMLVAALRTGRLLWWALLGVAIGGCLLTYHAAKAAVAVIAAVLLIEGIRDRDRWRQILPAVAVAAAALVVTVLPHLPDVVGRWDYYSTEMSHRFDVHELVEAWRSGDTATVRGHLERHVGWVAAVPFVSDQAGFVATGPLLDPVTAVLFVGAPLWLLLAWRHRGARILLIWVACYAVGSGMLTFRPPYKPRLVMALPAIVATVAILLDGADTERARGRRAWTSALPWVLAAACVAGGLAETWRRQVAPYSAGLRTSSPKSSLIHALRRLDAAGWVGGGRVVLLGATNRDEANLFFSQRHGLLTVHASVVDAGDDVAAVPIADPHGRPHAILVAPAQDGLLSVLRAHYPGAEEAEILGQRGERLFTELRLDRGLITRSQGWLRVDGESVGVAVVAAPFRLEAGRAGEWVGLVYVADRGSLELEAAGCPVAIVTLDGETRANRGDTLSVDAAIGWHAVRVTARAAVEVGCSADLRWRRPGHDWESVPRWAVIPAVEAHGLVLRVWRSPAGTLPEVERREPDLWRIHPVVSYDFDMIERLQTLPPVLHGAGWYGRWDGTIDVPGEGHWSLELDFDTAWAELSVAGLSATAANGGVARISGWLQPGRYPVTVRTIREGEAPLRRLVVKLRWAARSGQWETVPYQALRPAEPVVVRQAR